MKKVTILQNGELVKWPVVVPDKEAEVIAEDWTDAGYTVEVEDINK